jgi:hypothetical protein
MTRRTEIFLLAAGVCAFVAACLLTHPIGVTISDEVDYFTEAFAIRHGLPLGRADSYLLSNGTIPFIGPLYPAGWPALLAPFTSLRWPWVFAVTPALHVLGTIVLALVFRKRGLSPAWALLYLAQPTLLAFSRTLMAEPLAAFQTALLLLAAEIANPFLIGLVAGFAPLVKLSQILIAGPVVAVWLWRRPPDSRVRATLQATLGAMIGISGFLWFSRIAYGHWIGAGYGPTYASPMQALAWVGLGIAQLSVAWPLLTLGLLRSRAEEAAGAILPLLYLAVYGYHYRGPSLVATLVVGARLHSSAIVLLLPGYAALLAGLGRRSCNWALATLGVVAILAPFFILRAVSDRRVQLEAMHNQMLQTLRPGCIVGYSKSSLKLLLPLPPAKKVHGPEDVGRLDAALSRGECVDLVDPLSEPSTYQNPPSYPDPFATLIKSWPNRDRTPPGGVRMLWVNPR